MSYPVCENTVLGYYRTEAEIKTFRYTWEIPNFWDAYPLMFPVMINPDGDQPFDFELRDDASSEHLDLYMLTKSLAFKCAYRVSITHNQFTKETFGNDIILDVSEPIKEIFLFRESIEILSKMRDQYVTNNCLTIYFQCKWYIVRSEVSMHTTMKITYDELFTTNEIDLVPDKESLVTFIIGDERLYVNKNLICKNSTVFKAMFNCDMKERVTNEIRIIDTRYDIIKHILTFIQFNVLRNFDVNNVEILSELFIAADMYDIPDLKVLCEFQLIQLIDETNYIEFLKVAWLDSTTYLKNYIQQFLQIRGKRIFNGQMEELLKEKSESLLHATRCTKNVTASYNSATKTKIYL